MLREGEGQVLEMENEVVTFTANSASLHLYVSQVSALCVPEVS